MAEMLHQVTIDALPEKVFGAITTREGLIGWWTADVQGEPRAGTTAVFGFHCRTTIFRMDIDELTSPKCLRWSCRGDQEEWKGTRLRFDLHGREGGTVLRFTHEGWRSTEGVFRLCNTHWGALMVRLKSYVEGEAPGPFFRE